MSSAKTPVTGSAPAADRPAASGPATPDVALGDVRNVHERRTESERVERTVHAEPENIASYRERDRGGEPETTRTPLWMTVLAILVGIVLFLMILVYGRTAWNQQFPATTVTPTVKQEGLQTEIKTPANGVVTQELPAVKEPTLGALAIPVINGASKPAQADKDPVVEFGANLASDKDSSVFLLKKHKDNHEAIYIGPGEHMPRQVHVYSAPVQTAPSVYPIPTNVKVDAQIYLPNPPAPPAAPAAPAAPAPPTPPGVKVEPAPAAPVAKPLTQPTSYVAPATQQRVVHSGCWGK